MQTRSGPQSGFTMIELISIMVIVGILAAIAAPRFFSSNVFDSRGFYDTAISTLRYAQKEAIAQHRFVCVAFAANSITLTYGATNACGSNLTGPDGNTPYTVSSSKAVFAPTPAAFSFDALGQPSFNANLSITVNGYASAITVEARTGYVH
ncbi:MAG: prepilin-type N-terminal cleavage/methylation domain-containing protein [Nitrosomonadales bacterium]|nr:prepilin-type N-terminal cleavage/methylation domain-containing protein [Nitrosomonadales bacterium]